MSPAPTLTALADPFDWCIACDEQPAAGNGLLCSACNDELPFTVGDFLSQGVDQALESALDLIAKMGRAA